MKNVLRNVKFFGIWSINSIASLRLDTEFTPYAVAMFCFLWLVGLSFLLGVF